jgi:hypothetical protein
MFEFISKKIADIKILYEGYTADYFLNRMKPNALFPILFIQNNLKKKSGTDIFYQIIAHVHFREILSGYFLFSRFDWSIFVTHEGNNHKKCSMKMFPRKSQFSPMRALQNGRFTNNNKSIRNAYNKEQK